MVDPPVYPDPGGTVNWGQTTDGQMCAWAPARTDPDEWTVVLIAPAPRMAGFQHTAGQAFSTMLKDHIEQNPLRTLVSARDHCAGPVTFTPYFCDDPS